jgi:hypothetical protein
MGNMIGIVVVKGFGALHLYLVMKNAYACEFILNNTF